MTADPTVAAILLDRRFYARLEDGASLKDAQITIFG